MIGLATALRLGNKPSHSLLLGVSAVALATTLGAAPASAQLAAFRALNPAGIAAGQAASSGAVVPGARQILNPSMQSVIARAANNAALAATKANLVAEANAAARAAARAAVQLTPNGLGEGGLIAAAIPEELRAKAAAQGGQILLVDDATAASIWQGASRPVQTTDATTGAVTVSIDQSQSRAVLTWQSFNVGRDTTLTFNQSLNGVSRPDWIVLNRVNAATAPSAILGTIKADGTVLVLNQKGVLFGATAQVNLHSLLASSLEIGNFAIASATNINGQSGIVATSVSDRLAGFLQNGLVFDKGTLLSTIGIPGLAVEGTRPDRLLTDQIEGDVTVAAGATITARDGGYVMLIAPNVSNAGTLTAASGQVSLQSGRAVRALQSTGADDSIDSSVRGLILQTAQVPGASGGTVTNSGTIEATQGYISLGADITGTVENSGYIRSTTSVSRNGKISLTGGTINLAGADGAGSAATIVIDADSGAETIPQGSATNPSTFKTSKIEIGNRTVTSNPLISDVSTSITPGDLTPSAITIGRNALILAPGADVDIGGRVTSPLYTQEAGVPATRIDIESGAIIDVSGIKDVALDADRNSLEIAPAKRNELRDTPNYREASDGTNFTLNGETIYVDPRLSGVRSDGVAWIGSPLIEAGSLAEQIGVTARELMTKGGNINLAVAAINRDTILADTPAVRIASSAMLDYSGGWVRYAEGYVNSTRLIDASGALIDVSVADPNGNYVGVMSGYTQDQAKFGVSRTFTNGVFNGSVLQQAYVEGRDAGTLTIAAATAVIDGTLSGQSFAGGRQISGGAAASAASARTGDVRKLQARATELPTAGLLRIRALADSSRSAINGVVSDGAALGGDIVILQDGAAAPDVVPGTILISDSLINNAGLSGLSLQTSGAVTLAAGSNLSLNAGGALNIDAGRTISLDGTVTVPGGKITARTYVLSNADSFGSPFRTDDNFGRVVTNADIASPFDVIVNGTLSVAGRWVNDFNLDSEEISGPGYLNGGAISLTVAPSVITRLNDTQVGVDLSGSIRINRGALLNVSSGGYVAQSGTLTLAAKGGDVTLRDETVFARLWQKDTAEEGVDPFGIKGPAAPVTPGVENSSPILVPGQLRSVVSIADDTIRGYSFGGGGTFTLVTPTLDFGAEQSTTGTAIPLDFIQRTGFGTLDLTAWNTRIFGENMVLANGVAGHAAFLNTTSVKIAAGQTLNLSQTLFPSLATPANVAMLRDITTGADLLTVQGLAAEIPEDGYFQKAANIALRGLIELDVAAGGRIEGADGATITTAKLRNAGDIVLHGGTITQSQTLPAVYVADGIGISQLGDALSGAANGPVDENALAVNSILTNGELLKAKYLYFLGALGADEGIRLEAGSSIDLSGISRLNPLASLIGASGVQQRTGRLVSGGSIFSLPGTANRLIDTFSKPAFGYNRYQVGTTSNVFSGRTALRINALAGSSIDLSGAADSYDILASGNEFVRTAQWSDAGTLSALSGGTISGSTITAFSGSRFIDSGGAKGAGGTIEWLAPTLQQQDSGITANNILSADQIMAAGFDQFVARNSFATVGDVTVTLGKSFTLQSLSATGRISNSAPIGVTAMSNGATATINAPYVAFRNDFQEGAIFARVTDTRTAVTTFNAGAVDIFGGVSFAGAIGRLNLNATGDVRFTGVEQSNPRPPIAGLLSGQFTVLGDLSINAAQIYATTGTGGLQQAVEDIRAGRSPIYRPYAISSLGLTTGSTGTIRFGRSSVDVALTPYSAGSYLQIAASEIVQDGVLSAPLGRIDLGAGTTSKVTLGAGSITTVSADGLSIPYGSTTDLTEYFNSALAASSLTAAPTGELRITGDMIDIAEGATVDLSGGGDIFAFEFVPGTGGSRDVLSRFNTDRLSSNGYVDGTGFQYADRRQVYAILPSRGTDLLAAYDPLYSADYGLSGPVDLYGAAAGKTVRLDGVDGIPAGDYLLLPAKYALLPGAMRIVENSDSTVLPIGESNVLRDGSFVLGGTFGYAGAGITDPIRRSFTVQSQATFLKSSDIRITSATTAFNALAKQNGTAAPRSPLDAARVILSPLNALRVAGAFDTRPANGGRGSQIDISGADIAIVAAGTEGVTGVVTLATDTLANLQANSLLIGGVRTDNADGTTFINNLAANISIADGLTLDAGAELLLVVGGDSSRIDIGDGAVIRASTGQTVADSQAGDYLVPGGNDDETSAPTSFLRVANGVERLAQTGISTAKRPSTIAIGAARDADTPNISGQSVTLAAGRNLELSPTSKVVAPLIAVSAETVSFGGVDGIDTQMAASERLTIRSDKPVGFAAGTYNFANLVLDTPGLGLNTSLKTIVAEQVTINATEVLFRNLGEAAPICRGIGTFSCGTKGDSLFVNAGTIRFGSGTVRSFNFNSGVSLNATQGIYVEGIGGFDADGSNLRIVAPFIAERSFVVDPRAQAERPEYSFLTRAAFSLTAPVVPGAQATPSGLAMPGAAIRIGAADAPVASVAIDGAAIRATAGIIDIQSTGSISLSGAASLQTPGFERSFGDDQDLVTVSAGAGTINLVSRNGDIDLAATSALVFDNGIGNAGALHLIAGKGVITMGAQLNSSVSGSLARNASLTFNSGLSGFDLTGFLTTSGLKFGGDIAIHAGTGDLVLAAGQAMRNSSVALATENGRVLIDGTIDTSGINGGAISLLGANGVALGNGALLDSHSVGYAADDSRTAAAGNILLGVSNASAEIDLGDGATINAGASRGERLIASIGKDAATLNDTILYRYAEADKAGTVTLRAPVISAVGGDTVGIHRGTVAITADHVEVEGFRRFNLDAIATDDVFTGVTRDEAGAIHLNLAATGNNFLASNTAGTLVDFVRNFDVGARDGSSLDGFRLRPGLELNASGTIVLDTNWNLGAGTVTSYADAVEAGVMAVSTLDDHRLDQVLPGSTDLTRYYVVSGQEDNFFRNFVDLTYRVGGRVDGAAPVVSLRAGGALNIEHSITDGFFNFGDQTDPEYMSRQLGGGDRSFQPSYKVNCGADANCSDSVDYVIGAAGKTPPNTLSRITIALNTGLQAGTETNDGTEPAPFSELANSAAALGLGAGNSGDPIGSAELFPLLADGSAVNSSSLQLVAGAAAGSVDPLHVVRASNSASDGALRVSGETSYSVVANTAVGSYAGDLQLRYGPIVETVTDVQDFLSFFLSSVNQSPDIVGQYYTLLQWGNGTTGLPADVRAAASSYFASLPHDFLGPSVRPTGVAAPLSEILAFLQVYQTGLSAKLNSAAFDIKPPVVNEVNLAGQDIARVRTLVRTGTGSIALSSAGNVDLTDGQKTVFRNELGTNRLLAGSAAAQIGGAAIYTAGHRVEPSAKTLPVVGTSDLVTITPLAPPTLGGVEKYIPSIKGIFNREAVYATGGGSIIIDAGGSVIGRRDVWNQAFLGRGSLGTHLDNGSPVDLSTIGSSDQRWRTGQIGANTNIRIAAQYFTSGVGALGGGDVSIRAGRDVSDLTIALDTSVATLAAANGAKGLMTFGGGNLSLVTGGDLLGGQIDVANGAGTILVGGAVRGTGTVIGITGFYEATPSTSLLQDNLLGLRVSDATISLTARSTVTIAGISALGALPGGTQLSPVDPQFLNNAGYYTARSGLSITAGGDVLFEENRREQIVVATSGKVAVLPASLEIRSITGDIDLDGSQQAGGVTQFLYPGATGQLSLIAGRDLKQNVIAMSDADPTTLPGAFTVYQQLATGAPAPKQGLDFTLPVIPPTVSDATLRLYHNGRITHAGDLQPVRAYAGRDIVSVTFSLPKQARIGAGRDISDMIFSGQNLSASDVTRITAGRDIIGTLAGGELSGTTRAKPYVRGNYFVLGGPGALFVEAGRNLGPFLSSVTADGNDGVTRNFAGGIRTVGNELNPWLGSAGAKIYTMFGVANGADYTALRDTYLNPATGVSLDGDLFVQVTDEFGNEAPDRTRPIYAPILAEWLRDNEPTSFAAVFGNGVTFASDTALATTAYGETEALYDAFVSLPKLRQQQFLLDKLYFNELAAVADPESPSFQQYVRGYRAVQTLFPTALGYTDNLATYQVDPATINADHPLGVPAKILANPFTNEILRDSGGAPITDVALAPTFVDPATGRTVSAAPLRATRVSTGNADLRLATIQSARGGDVTIIGPGGDMIAGSVVRTEDQINRKGFAVASPNLPPQLLGFGNARRGDGQNIINETVTGIPIGYEGVLSLRNGAIRSFTDGDFRLNQSRVFSLRGGDITMWSSNGDLNAGQGPKSASNFPPVTVRFSQDGFAEVNTVASVAGAGIGAFQPSIDVEAPNVVLIAPVGTVDAGDAGVRAGGSLFVAAAQVANSDNFNAGGDVSGVPSVSVAQAPALPASAASAVANVFRANAATGASNDTTSRISVDVLGYFADDDASDEKKDDQN